VLRVHVLDHLLVRHDHPPRQRGHVVLFHRRHQHTTPGVRRDVWALLKVPVRQQVVCSSVSENISRAKVHVDRQAEGKSF
jgi:hypothetical protein